MTNGLAYFAVKGVTFYIVSKRTDWRHHIQNNDTQHNDTQHNNTQGNDSRHNDTHQDDTHQKQHSA